jgi:hypothetical protein
MNSGMLWKNILLNNYMFSDLQNIYMLMEDLQSSLSQTKNILKNNGVQNFEEITKDLQNIYDSVEFESDEHRNSKSDQDIPNLAYLVLAGWNTSRISEIYKKYCNTKAIYSQNYISRWGQEIRNTIQKNKWFKPSEEKTKYIQDESNQLIEMIHKHYIPPENKIEDTPIQSSDDDIVYEDDTLLIYRADSMEKCILYGNKNLCISYPKKDNYYWKYRLGKMRGDNKGMTTYFVNWKDGSNKILIDSLGDSDGKTDEYSWNPITTNTDRDISKEELIGKFPDLKAPFDNDVFQFVEYGENEARAYEIDENIDSILDSNLKGFADYDIFVQLDKNISDKDWNDLKLDDKTKRILFKKYMGAGGLVSYDNIKKYGDIKDLNWYEDILSRNKDKSIRYYLNLKGNVKNSKIIEYYSEEKKKVDVLEKIIRAGDFISLSNENLYFLPNISDIEWVGDFNCSHNPSLTSLSGAPQKIGRYFNCYNNPSLTSLSGAPQQVGGNFNCYNNPSLTSLSGAPQQVGGTFNCFNNRSLTSLSGAPQQVGRDFNCYRNPSLTSLSGAPQQVGGFFDCSDNESLKSLSGAPQKIGGDFNCYRNPSLTSLSGAPQKIGGNFNCSYNESLTSFSGAPQKIGGGFHGYRNPSLTSISGAPEENNPELKEWGENMRNSLQKEIESEFNEDEPLKEHYNFEYLYERVLEIFSESVSKPIDKKTIKKIVNDMGEIENKNFSPAYAADSEDLIDDSKLNGFIGYGLFSNEKIVGYIYGYRMGADGEYDDIDIDYDSINFYDDNFKQLIQSKGFEKICNPKNTFYVSNLAINKENRIGLTKILTPFLEDIKRNGYQFIVFDGLEDTLRLLKNEDRLQKMRMKIMAKIDDYNSSLVLLRIN